MEDYHLVDVTMVERDPGNCKLRQGERTALIRKETFRLLSKLQKI